MIPLNHENVMMIATAVCVEVLFSYFASFIRLVKNSMSFEISQRMSWKSLIPSMETGTGMTICRK